MSFLAALRGVNVGRPPIWIMRQAGRYMPSYRALRKKYDFLTLCHTPELITEVTLLPIKEFDLDAAIVFSDILLIPQAMGMQLHFDEGIGPVISNDVHEMHAFTSLPFVNTAIKNLKKALKVPLIGFAGAPFTLASYWIEGKTSRDLKKTKVWAYQNPENFQKIISKLEDAIYTSLLDQLKSGCDALQLFDSWAHVLTESQFQKWCLEPLKRLVNRLPKDTPLIYFCKGSSLRAHLIEKTGVTCISCDWQAPINKVRKQTKIALQGNLDPEALFLPKDELKGEVKALLDSMHQDPAYIFNLGHGILPDTPYENVQALVEKVKLG